MDWCLLFRALLPWDPILTIRCRIQCYLLVFVLLNKMVIPFCLSDKGLRTALIQDTGTWYIRFKTDVSLSKFLPELASAFSHFWTRPIFWWYMLRASDQSIATIYGFIDIPTFSKDWKVGVLDPAQFNTRRDHLQCEGILRTFELVQSAHIAHGVFVNGCLGIDWATNSSIALGLPNGTAVVLLKYLSMLYFWQS
jgi:hypothetical protein